MVRQLPPNMQFRPMQQQDVNDVLRIIYETDEDDYQSAAEEFQNEGTEDYFVLTMDGTVIGMSGLAPADQTNGSFFISWSFIDGDHTSDGSGSYLMEQMLGVIQQRQGRKVFANVSDYVDPEDGDVYRHIKQMYVQAGFVEELRHPNYYNPNEALIAYGMRVDQLQPRQAYQPDPRQIRLTDVDEIPDTNDAYFIAWEYTDGEGSTQADFQRVIQEVESWEARCVFISIPSDAEQLIQMLINCRFRQEGQLSDYFEDGIHEIHFRYDLAMR